MPQVDLAAVCGGTPDRKIACETIATEPESSSQLPDQNPLDYAPDSFFLSKDAELDWLDRNAFMERKDSGKGAPPAPPQPPLSYSGNLKKSKASIIGLPRRQKTNYKESDHKPRTVWVLPKRSESASGKETEPSSPKVSCMGKVRSKKDQKRRTVASGTKEKPVGVWRRFGCLFGARGNAREEKTRDEEAVKVERVGSVKEEAAAKVERVGSVKEEAAKVERVGSVKEAAGKLERVGSVKGELPAAAAVEAEPPQLGAMQRFTSGRRSDAWAADVAVHVQVES